ncbi:hypothetical protein [Draconibacterium sp.]|uniref:hypothetical protein n=1 Tax=Draconibacterium sp. TaxID=1965318 RepID=UPI003561CB6B
MKKMFLLLLLVQGIVMAGFSQESNEEFKPSGKAVFKVFTNWHQGFGGDSEVDYAEESGFELTRGVIGYEYQFAPRLSSKVIVDMDNPNSGKLTEVAYIRNAYLAYEGDRLSAVFGILGMKQFKTQENYWGYRYIYKSAMDEYKFNNSVDAGIILKYKVFDWLSADMAFTNGEGAKKQQDTEGKYRVGYGLELEPIDGLAFRTYYDYFYAPDATEDLVNENQDMISFFLGYEKDNLRLGVEYDMLKNYKFNLNDDRDIFSAYGSLLFKEKFQAFIRYDKLMAENALASENVAMAGMEWAVVKGVKISPNFRYKSFQDTDQPDAKYFYLNFEYKF